ncbi:universal stress protein PHOS34-like isoform X1 [Magnolia sinica]|uniref:universal stress protein PHOS34-like isoform X1 n=1 Tax=Magnolia sinica TaxID=86752 RepID=UPI002659CF94|nr:universal stress protein PHOS34-like isoform X1 [Magnolia sinica]
MASNRNIGIAVDFSPCSRKAITWVSENLLREGDHLIVINIQPSFQYEKGEMQLWEATGSPIIPLSEFSNPSISKKYGVNPEKETLDILSRAAGQNGVPATLSLSHSAMHASTVQINDVIHVVVAAKIYWGDAGKKICKAIEKIPLHCLVIGSRGLSKVKRVLLGSVSKYVVNHAACPVTVVKNL